MTLLKKYIPNRKLFKPSLISLIITRVHIYKKIMDQNNNNQLEKINYDHSKQEFNYIWATQDIDSKEFYKKIKIDEIFISKSG